ncbi:fatty acid desaturase [Aromatoleum toluclasticum]|uniref:DesA family fatty acid desaturase n=1 Tax=Aromatoleum toluclasticum TaxID=92003 RepID=UPI001D18A064|nr:fatty acid desaturase [Aromatoleum toluclasticum]MCC4115520.1 fatty acid desaturase [Aromatoleum toluclasticum]
MLQAVFELPWWAYIAVTLALTHVTIAAVTIFLHRHQAHRALELHPATSHFFRFWLWLTTGMVTREWVAIHRKHHARCDDQGDPHSPQLYGIRRVLWTGAELYRAEAQNADTISRYGRGTPDDWLERRVYARHPILGVALMLVADLVLFGPIGLTMWAVQMMWIPFFAAGVVNGVGHFWGYRSFATGDASRNIAPWGILIGGEELHNNHHAYSASARLSNRWWEFDIGWMYIRLLQALGFAKVLRVAPRLRIRRGKDVCDAETVQAVITHRFDVLSTYARSLRRTAAAEIRALRARAVPGIEERRVLRALRLWLQRDAAALPATDREALERALDSSPVLRTIAAKRRDLAALWERSVGSKEQLVRQLEEWCQSAEASGIAALRDFSRRLRCYA